MSNYNYANVPQNKIARVGRHTYIESSLHFTSNHVTLDKRKHVKLYDDIADDLASLCDENNQHFASDD